jgi:hypothetical protein
MALDQVLEQLNCKIKAVLGGLNLLNKADEGKSLFSWCSGDTLGIATPRPISCFYPLCVSCQNQRSDCGVPADHLCQPASQARSGLSLLHPSVPLMSPLGSSLEIICRSPKLRPALDSCALILLQSPWGLGYKTISQGLEPFSTMQQLATLRSIEESRYVH